MYGVKKRREKIQEGEISSESFSFQIRQKFMRENVQQFVRLEGGRKKNITAK